MTYEDLIYQPSTDGSGPVRRLGDINVALLEDTLKHSTRKLNAENKQVGLRWAGEFEGVSDLRYANANPKQITEKDFKDWIIGTEFLQDAIAPFGLREEGRVRLLLLPPRTCYSFHADLDLWRVHIPLKTNPGAFMFVNGKMWHLEEGGIYLVNVENKHTALNTGDEDRIHIVFDWCDNLAGDIK